MSKIEEIFRGDLEGRLLSIYTTAGFPHLDSTIEVMKALQENGADMIELGMPYSDPLADGPIIQNSSAIALRNGMTIRKLFEQLEDFRKEIQIPVVLMGYLNPVMQYGFQKFCADAASVGVDGLIIPDLPEHEFETRYGAIIHQHGLDFMFLVTPETSDERIRRLDSLSSGFLYAVSSSSTTGGSGQTIKGNLEYLKKLNNMKLLNPVLVGFGIRDKAGFDAVCQFAPGAIIGSAYIKALEDNPDVNAATKSFLSSIKLG